MPLTRTCALIVSDDSFAAQCRDEAEKAKGMLSAGAFTHWYERHGLSTERLSEAISRSIELDT